MLVFFDTCTLGVLVNPNNTPKTREIRLWMKSHLEKGVGFRVPEIADYELRRNLIFETLRAANSPSIKSIQNLDNLKITIGYVPLSTDTILTASAMWAAAKKGNYSTAHKFKLDGDVILAAQAIVESAATEKIIIATRNVRHLSQYSTVTVEAREWKNI
jgi:predicted nucleic acid-binding protein